MSDRNNDFSQPTSSLSDLTLSVKTEGGPEQEVFLQHGLSIGRNPSNTICLDAPGVERIHAQVMKQADGTMMLECLDAHMELTLANGNKVSSLKLSPGTTFKLGKSTIRCLKRDTKPTVLVADNPWKIRCPKCHAVIADLPHDGKACPACALELMYFQQHTSPAEPDAFEGWLPRKIGPYRIRAFVAQGGMGIVLRGLHEELDSPAAVKLLRIDSDKETTWRDRFAAEVETLKAMKHPNVVRLQANGKDDKLLWLAMDWIDGQSLTKWAGKARESGQPVSIEQIKSVLTQAVQGLVYLHGKGIIHRDLKPSNILLAQDDSVKMVDFGIARATHAGAGMVTQMTRTGVVAGTESYMSPEQSEGQSLTSASDIYSFGVIWYELVTGRRPVGAFSAPNIARPDCPAAWSTTITQCLSSEPRTRPTAEQLAGVLSGLGLPPVLPGDQGNKTGQNDTPKPPPLTPTNTGGASEILKNVTDVGIDVAKKGFDVAKDLIQKSEPQKWGGKAFGLAGKLKGNRPAQIGVGLLLLVIIVVMAVASGKKKPDVAGGGGTGGGVNPPVNPNPGPNPTPNPGPNPNPNPVPNPNPTPPQQTPQQLFVSAMALSLRVSPDADANDPTAQRVIKMMETSANGGYMPAAQYLGRLYTNNDSNFYDYDEGIRWVRKAAQLGDQQARQYLMQNGMRW